MSKVPPSGYDGFRVKTAFSWLERCFKDKLVSKEEVVNALARFEEDERVIPFHERKLRLAVDNTINPPDKTVTVVLWRDTLEDDNKNDNNSGQRNWNVERAFSSKDLAIAYIEKQERRNEYRIAWGYREILLDKSE